MFTKRCAGECEECILSGKALSVETFPCSGMSLSGKGGRYIYTMFIYINMFMWQALYHVRVESHIVDQASAVHLHHIYSTMFIYKCHMSDICQ